MNNALADQLEAAVIALAAQGSLKDRLGAAYCNHLEDIDAHDLPLEAQQDFAELSKAMHAARALPGDNVVRASVRKFSNQEAQRYAAIIVRLYGLEMQNATEALTAPARLSGPPRAMAPLAALLALEGGNQANARTKRARDS